MTQIFITQFDLNRLHKILKKRAQYDEYDRALLVELDRARVVEPQSIPADVITMNSLVKLTDESGKSSEYSLVFPEDADMTAGKISVLSPIGCSLIGYKVGQSIEIPAPKGNRKLTVEEILYQPERSGNFDL